MEQETSAYIDTENVEFADFQRSEPRDLTKQLQDIFDSCLSLPALNAPSQPSTNATDLLQLLQGEEDKQQTCSNCKSSLFHNKCFICGYHWKAPRKSVATSNYKLPVHHKLISKVFGDAVIDSDSSINHSLFVGSEREQESRNWIVISILSSQMEYVEVLTSLMNNFITPLNDALRTTAPILTAEEIHSLFSDIREIYELHSELVTALDRRLEKSLSEPVADLFQQLVPRFAVYSSYCNNLSSMKETLQRCLCNPQFKLFIENTMMMASQNQFNSFEDYLYLPVNVFTAFTLLLELLLHHTDSSHGDHSTLCHTLKHLKSIPLSDQHSIQSSSLQDIQQGDEQLLHLNAPLADRTHAIQRISRETALEMTVEELKAIETRLRNTVSELSSELTRLLKEREELKFDREIRVVQINQLTLHNKKNAVLKKDSIFKFI